ncbi:pantetheine-phosphate adenylyltransferase [Vagococcus sp.]|uniref:pantetheine-phosphate adenylyltransferase n=1 Tax=Vagococcus sp. TaxID=1933889 RepID=UPI003F9690CC
MTNKKIAIFPGSFDPFTNGHLNTVKRASDLFDEVIITVATNTSKKELFTSREKLELIENSIVSLKNVKVVLQPNQLTVDVAVKYQAHFLIRGIRNNQDFEYEKNIAFMNKKLNAQVETIFLLADENYSSISSSMIKEIAKFGGDISSFVPKNVKEALNIKFSGQSNEK